MLRRSAEAALRALRSGQYILGKEVEQFERAGAALAGARHGIGVASGTDAILLALMPTLLGGRLLRSRP